MGALIPRDCAGSPWGATWPVRSIDDAPEAIRDGDEDEDHEGLSHPFRE
jgi:hypothetical protein